jgi:DNA-binding response OmpR family regulator
VTSIFVAGLDSRGLLIEAPILQREGCAVDQKTSGRELLGDLMGSSARLVVLGPRLDDLPLVDAVRRIRTTSQLRAVSILALIPTRESPEIDQAVLGAGANAVLRRPLDRGLLEGWLAKLLTVARRVEVRIPVDGQVVGSARQASAGHFYGVASNLSTHGLLLACPVRLAAGHDIELDLRLSEAPVPLRLLGRVVRESPDVRWPYLGYGIEFLCVPQTSLSVVEEIVRTGAARFGMPREDGIHSTLRRGLWVYEILQPTPCEDGWQVEIRRAPHDLWQPGSGGPFFVVSAASPTEALLNARDFLSHHA